MWSLDNYDGPSAWVEMRTLPDEKHEEETNTTAAQHRGLRANLMQLDIETNSLVEGAIKKQQRQSEWKRIQTIVKLVCMEACEEVEQFKGIVTEVRQRITTSCCGRPDEVRIHDGGVRSEEDHVDSVRAIEHLEDETHDDYHDGKVETARGLEDTRGNNHCEHPPRDRE